MKPGFLTTIGEVVRNKIDKSMFVETLRQYLLDYEFVTDTMQWDAWEDCFKFLKRCFSDIESEYYGVPILFEYMLPMEMGRRPDVILLTKEKVIILEFKMKNVVHNGDIEQAIGYREDIRFFHKTTNELDLQVSSYLVLTKSDLSKVAYEKGLPILSEKTFLNEIKEQLGQPLEQEKVKSWYESDYVVLPNIIEAVQDLFHNGNLPYIKTVAESEIKNAVDFIASTITENERMHENRIILLSGVPGSGKTLVGLQTVYDVNKKAWEEEQKTVKAIYLSGNGPLVNVLQHQLSSKAENIIDGKSYIRSMRAFKTDYILKNKVPENTVIVFDESQRAWDESAMKADFNEIEGLLRLGEQVNEKCGSITIVCLYGEGQSIYKGEEKGMELWKMALQRHPSWKVYMPEFYAKQLSGYHKVNVKPELHLDVSIRNNFIDTSKWIELILNNDFTGAANELQKLCCQNYRIRITRNFNALQKVMPLIKNKQPSSRYGLLVSSYVRDQNLRKATDNYVKTSYISEKDAFKWFDGECELLTSAASEFLCQGLELEMPIVTFGGDYVIENGHWTISSNANRVDNNKFLNVDQIFQNVYRVLLSRGRRGMILFIPMFRELDDVYTSFKAMGVDDLI